MSPVRRIDVSTSRIRTDMRTPQGFARIPANLTRTGVFEYTNPDGSTRREYRPADEVFRKDSIATLDTAAVTVGHPTFVDASNWKSLSVGSLLNSRPAAPFVASEVIVNESGALQRVDSGELVELSCGYDCDLEVKAGVTPTGERFDAIQRNIKYNHVALLPAGTGRAGGDVRLRLDSADGGTPIAVSYTGTMSDESTTKVAELQSRLDTVTADADAVRKDRKAATQRADQAEAKVDALEKTVDELTKKLELTTKRADSAEAGLAPDRIDSLIAERFELAEKATLLHGKRVDTKGTALEVKTAALLAYDAELRLDGKSADYIDARFDLAVEAAVKAGASLAKVNGASAAPRADAVENEISKAQKADAEHQRSRFAASLTKKEG